MMMDCAVLNAFYTTLAQEAHMTLQIRCRGDVWVNDHHTAEDVSIAVGQCLTQALGSKAGLNRMWVGSATTVVDKDDSHSDQISKVEVTMDLSN
jgi:imidazoleglycerol-phosphate dehydratase